MQFGSERSRTLVFIEKNGRRHMVLLSHVEYARLQAMEDRFWGAKAPEAEQRGMLTPQETMAFLNAST